MSKQMKYVFAFPSPFAALADARIDDLVAEAGGELLPIPVVPPPSEPPQGLAATVQEFKLSYLLEDAERWARKLGIPWNPPTQRNVDANDATAGYYLAHERGCERPYRNAVFRARWSEGRDIGDRTVLAACAEGAGLDRKDFLAALDSGRYHEQVPGALQTCIEDRVFGVPIFIVNGTRFWGNDRLDLAIEELRRA